MQMRPMQLELGTQSEVAMQALPSGTRVLVGVAVGVCVGVAVGVCVGVSVGVSVWVAVGV